ncbi:MAG: DUF3558 domain-containing protein [Actinomycetota bacterium]|nr:DUF3558 domain-containing protein [Actinomycetota bacterium]
MPTHPTRALAAALASAILLLTGCTANTAGQPTPTAGSSGLPTETGESPRPTTSAATSLPSYGAPVVKDPLDTGRFQKDPCLAVTATQAEELGITPQGEQRDAPLGLACRWGTVDMRGGIDLQWVDKPGIGISGDYKANQNKKYKYFAVLPDIEGFPAIAGDVLDRRPDGSCSVSVGVSDQVAFFLALTQSRDKVGTADPCDVAVRVAGMVLRTMKAGA